MTKDHLDDHIKNAMLDSLLPEKESAKRVSSTPKRRPGEPEFDWNRGDPLPFDEDEAIDDLYRRRTTSYSKQETSPRASVFKRNEKSPLVDAIELGATDGKRWYIDKKQKAQLIDAYMRILAKANDEAGIIWSSQGTQYARAMLQDLTNELFFGGMRVLVGDARTGEVEDER